MSNKVRLWIVKNQILILIASATVLLRIPSWFEPYWYGDEAIYLTIGQAISKGVNLYGQIHDNKPPFLYLMAAFAGGDQFWFKFIATFWTLITIVFFAKLAERLSSKRWLVVSGIALFAFITTWPKIEGNIANAELFFILFTTWTVSLLWKKDLGIKQVFFAGTILGLGGLFKMPAILEAAIWPLLWLVFNEKDWWKKTIVLGVGVAVPLILSLIYFYLAGTGSDYLIAAWAQNLPYLSSWKVASDSVGVYSLKGRAVVLIAALAVIYGLSRKWGKNATVVISWLCVSLFGALLSGRPYPHYMIQIAAPAVLAIMLIFSDKKPAKLLSFLGIVGVIAAIKLFSFYNYPVISYYKNFGDWASGRKTSLEYVEWFGQETKKNYEVSAWVKTLTIPNKPIFVWGDQPMIYAITRRSPVGKYTVKYHIKDFHAEDSTMNALQTVMPQVVVSYGSEQDLPGFDAWLTTNYEIEKIVDGTKIYSKRSRI
jgi:4-amino-4-deoxy-L-arabinose transferase-like glycosyltransferase